MAPEGCDAWYVLSPVPNLQAGIDWASEGERYRDRIVELARRRFPGRVGVGIDGFAGRYLPD